MSIRRRLGVSALMAAAAMCVLTSAGDSMQTRELKPARLLEEYDLEFKPEYRERRKRGGNGKGRKWWNS